MRGQGDYAVRADARPASSPRKSLPSHRLVASSRDGWVVLLWGLAAGGGPAAGRGSTCDYLTFERLNPEKRRGRPEQRPPPSPSANSIAPSPPAIKRT